MRKDRRKRDRRKHFRICHTLYSCPWNMTFLRFKNFKVVIAIRIWNLSMTLWSAEKVPCDTSLAVYYSRFDMRTMPDSSIYQLYRCSSEPAYDKNLLSCLVISDLLSLSLGMDSLHSTTITISITVDKRLERSSNEWAWCINSPRIRDIDRVVWGYTANAFNRVRWVLISIGAVKGYP